MFKKGQTAWNKGLTKETDSRVARTGSRIGHPAWCKGLTKETDERVARQAKALSNRWANPTEAQLLGLEKTRQAHIGMKRTIEARNKMSIKAKERELRYSKEYKKSRAAKGRQSFLSKMQDPEFADSWYKSTIEGIRKLWSNPKHVAKMIKSFQLKPTSIEKRLIEICNKYFPEFKYNGDFSQGVTLGGLTPDFVNVNGKKQVIEVFGDYWHSPDVIGDDWRRTELGKYFIYGSIGYDCLVIWEHELNELPEERIVKKIRKFTKARR